MSWTHIKTLIYLDDTLKRDFYIEMARLENWSARQLQERIQSMLYERTAISRKPEDTFRNEIGALREQGQSNIRVADYLTLLPPREILQDKLHRSIEIARQPLVQGDQEEE